MKTLATLALSLAAVAPGLVAQESPIVVPLVMSLEAGFTGFTAQGEAAYAVTIQTAPFSMGSDYDPMIIVLRDGGSPPPFNPLAPGAYAEHRGNARQAVTETYELRAPSYFKGPVHVDVWWSLESQLVIDTIGPLQIPREGTGIVPYGMIGAGANRLPLHADGFAGIGQIVSFELHGASDDARAWLALGAARGHHDLLGGTLLIDAPLVLLEMERWEDLENLHLDLVIPQDPGLQDVMIRAQAVAVSERGVLLSNGIEMLLHASITTG